MLYLFLVEFATWDWDRDCLSLQGPVPLSSFPSPKPAPCEELLNDPMLGEEFMAEAYSNYTQPLIAGLGDRPFAIKTVNIMDPLLPSNNLGRSVGRASYLRIRRAAEQGARRLAGIAEEVGRGVVGRGVAWRGSRRRLFRRARCMSGATDSGYTAAAMGRA